MEIKKNEKYDIEGKRPLFFGIGMILSLAFVIAAFEWKTEIEPIDVFVFDDDDSWNTEIILATEHKKKEPPKPKIRKPIEVIEPNEELKSSEEKPVLDTEPKEESSIFGSPTETIPVEIPEEAPFITVEEMPSFPGGIKEFYQFLGSNMKYPSRAKRIGAEGKVFIKFIVERDGSLSNLEVIKGIGSGCDLEALRVMGLVPSFSPGKQRGIPVRVQMVVPINFQLK